MNETPDFNPAHKVLVVDDDQEIVDFLSLLLKEHINVSYATNGPDALTLARTHKPDLILLDVMMPDMGGFEVCRKLKDDPETKHIPVLFLTAMDDDASVARGLGIGAVDYIAKPFVAENVIAKVRNWLTHLPRQSAAAPTADSKPTQKYGKYLWPAVVGVLLGALFFWNRNDLLPASNEPPPENTTTTAPTPNREIVPESEKIDLDISTACQDDAVTFIITNKGSGWPRIGFMRVYRIDSESVIVERQLRLAKNQTASFKVGLENFGLGGGGLWIKPTWYSRDFRYDITVNCR